MSDKKMLYDGIDSDMQTLCSWLGKIPVSQLVILNQDLPEQWASFSADEWEQFISKAQEQGLAPLLYWVLSKSGKFSSLPESTRNSLRIKYAATWLNNQAILKELEILAEAFTQAGIPIVVLKGACFAQTIYPDIGLRPMGDLDVLVPASKVSEAVRVARLFGYFEYVEAEPEASPGLRAMFNKDVCLQKNDPHLITLEIHTSLVANSSFKYAVPVDWFWEQVEPMQAELIKNQDHKLLMLKPEAQVLYASAHLMFQHGGYSAPMRWFYDLDRLVRFYSGRLDWDLLLSQARISEWGSALEAALSRIIVCFGTPIPGHVMTDLNGISDRHQEFVRLKQAPLATHWLEERRKLLSLNWSWRIRVVGSLIVPGPKYMRWRYSINNFWQLPGYYLLRWWGILKDALRTLLLTIRK